MSEGRTAEKLELAARLVGYANGTRYRVRGNFLFQGISLIGMHVLEIGCGTGAWAIWAALHGADRVVAIEPEADGSTENTLTKLRQTIETLELSNKVVASNQYLHELPVQNPPFDVVVMYNVINHLDEEAVVALSSEGFAYERYVTLLEDLRLRMRSGGWAIVADCARSNFWARLGLRSPLAPTIEWHKHQNPRTWIDVFKNAGFESFDVRWSPLQPLPKLTANRLVQYLTLSHFVLRFRVSKDLSCHRTIGFLSELPRTHFRVG